MANANEMLSDTDKYCVNKDPINNIRSENNKFIKSIFDEDKIDGKLRNGQLNIVRCQECIFYLNTIRNKTNITRLWCPNDRNIGICRQYFIKIA